MTLFSRVYFLSESFCIDLHVCSFVSILFCFLCQLLHLSALAGQSLPVSTESVQSLLPLHVCVHVDSRRLADFNRQVTQTLQQFLCLHFCLRRFHADILFMSPFIFGLFSSGLRRATFQYLIWLLVSQR